jgi:putative restriction endonuclease
MPVRVWTVDETLLAFYLYCETPYGRIDARNTAIKELAEWLGRTPGAVAMKMLSLASHDPRVIERGRKGLQNASKLDTELWEKFHAHIDQLFWAGEEALKRLGHSPQASSVFARYKQFTGATEVLRETPARRAQSFFRETVLTAYGHTCAVSGIDKPELLIASHIIPWAKAVDRRADPCNGLALSALHDRAFDRGLITVDDGLALVVSPRLKTKQPNSVIRTAILEFEGKPLSKAERFAPDPEALAYHRERIFLAG